MPKSNKIPNAYYIYLEITNNLSKCCFKIRYLSKQGTTQSDFETGYTTISGSFEKNEEFC